MAQCKMITAPSTTKQRNKSYKRRWYVLFVFSTTAFMQSAVWNTWGPITQSAEVAFGWKDSQIGLLANWGNISFLITVFPTCYLMDTRGPQLVTSPKYISETLNQNFTPASNRSAADLDLATLHTSRNNLNSSQVLVNLTHIRQDIMYLMYYEFAAIGLLFLCSLFMPSKPPIPPSLSASTGRVVYRKALLQIARNKAVWLIGLAYALPSGVYGAWVAVLDFILNPIGIGQIEVGWIGFYSIMAGCVTGVTIGRFSDVFMRHMKLFVLIMFGVAGGSFVWFTLICVKVIPISTVQVYLSSILGSTFLCGTLPLFYELGAESAFPASEGVTGGFLTWLNNVVGMLFLLLPQIPGIGTEWVNWTLVGSVALGLFFLFVFPEKYNRSDMDSPVNKTEYALYIPADRERDSAKLTQSFFSELRSV